MNNKAQTGFILGLTAVFIGYLSVWLPGPGAGLSIIGIEMGEWFKFVGLGARRDIFYLPPITLGLIMGVWTSLWGNGRWQTWVMRGLAVGVSLLAFPAIEDILGPSRSQYVLRVMLILVVIGVVLLAAWLSQRSLPALPVKIAIIILGLIGAIWPTWLYFEIRPFTSNLLGEPLGIGLGVYLNGIGHLIVAVASLRVCESASS